MRTAPRSSVGWVPMCLRTVVTRGEMMRACEMDSPPTKPNSRCEAWILTSGASSVP